MWLLLIFLAALFIAYLLVWGVLRFGFRQFLFLPERLPANFEFHFSVPFREIYLDVSPNVRVHGLYFPIENARGIVFFHHGNRDNVARWGNLFRDFHRLGYDVLIYDYRGYGKSEGVANETNLYADAEMWYDWIRKQGYPPEQIVVYGRSLGAVAATYVAAQLPIKQLILETPFASLRSLFYELFSWLPNLFAVQYEMSNLDRLRHVDVPITIFHGTKDQIVPLENAARLRSALKRDDRFVVIDGAYHNDIMTYDRYHQELRQALT